MKLKKLRKHSEALVYRIRILEAEQRLAELQQPKETPTVGFTKRGIKPSLGDYIGTHIYDDTYIGEGVTIMGGKPNPGTPKDKRLKENKPKASKPKPITPPKKG